MYVKGLTKFIRLHNFFASTVELRNRAAAIELEKNSTKFGPSSHQLSRSRSAQSLKLLGDTATQVN